MGIAVSDDGELLAAHGASRILIVNLKKKEFSSANQMVEMGAIKFPAASGSEPPLLKELAEVKTEVDPKTLQARMQAETKEGHLFPMMAMDFRKMPHDEAFLPGTHTLCVLTPGVLLLIDGDSRTITRAVPIDSKIVYGGRIVAAPGGKQVAFTAGVGRIDVVDLEREKILYTLKDVLTDILQAGDPAEYDLSGSWIAAITADGKSVGIWNASTGEPKGLIKPPPVQKGGSGPAEQMAVTSLAWIPKTSLLVLGRGPELLIYDAQAMRLTKSIRVEEPDWPPQYGAWTPSSICASPDGQSIAVVQDIKKITLWDRATGSAIRNVNLPMPPEVNSPSIRFFENGRYLLVYSAYDPFEVLVVDFQTGEIIYNMERDSFRTRFEGGSAILEEK